MTLTHAKIDFADMGEKNITTDVRIDSAEKPEFPEVWAVAYRGEKYIMPVHRPSGDVSNEELNASLGLTFQHWAIYQLKRWPFVTIQSIATGEAVADEEVADVRLNPADFLDLFSKVLAYYYGDTITLDINPAWAFSSEAVAVSINHTLVWDVLVRVNEITGARWFIAPRADNDVNTAGGERYVIKVGYPAPEIDHLFECGSEGGILSASHQVQSEEIRNMVKGRGGSKNIPKYYFKKSPDEKKWESDSDWITELDDIYFTNLMGATFRSYVQGWKAAHKSSYPGYTPVGEANAYSPWAYRKGFTDTRFNAVEFVADEITLSPKDGDKRVEIMPGFAPYVTEGSSLYSYGPLQTTLDNDEETYPSLQGTGMDVAIDVEHVETDGMETEADRNAVIDKAPSAVGSIHVRWGSNVRAVLESGNFEVPKGRTANLSLDVVVSRVIVDGILYDRHLDTYAMIMGAPVIRVFDTNNTEHSTLDIPSGKWTYRVEVNVENQTLDAGVTATVATTNEKLELSDEKKKIGNTFDLWIKNIFGSERKTISENGKVRLENDSEYSHRIWDAVLGDRLGTEAKVMFTSGNLAVSDDYEFVIADYPVPDQSKVHEGEQSHWRIPLYRSDADYESLDVYVPNTKRQGNPGDTFVFIGTELTHRYITEAEKRVDNNKKDRMAQLCDIKPTWRVTLDRVRAASPDAVALTGQLREGAVVRLSAKRLFGASNDKFHVQSLSISYREPTESDNALNPDIEMILGEDYGSSAGNVISELSGQVDVMRRQIGSLSNIEQLIRKVCDRIYLRKDGLEDQSLSPTRFLSLLTSGDFRPGYVGGQGWGIFKSSDGSWTAEFDDLNVRHNLAVNNLVINQISAFGGTRIESAALMEVTNVVDRSDGYYCYFDQKSGTVANCFAVDDVAYSQRFDATNAKGKYYKRKVVKVGADHIVLSKTIANGTGMPEKDDVIVQYGNYTDANRQYVIVRDVIGGGYERYIENLGSVDAPGREYYFVGRQKSMDNGNPRFYLGNEDAYIEYRNGKLTICGELSVKTTIGNKNLDEYIKSLSADVVASFKVLYASGNTATKAPPLPTLNADGTIDQYNGWSESAPAWADGRYIWQTTYTLYKNGTGTFSDAVCISGRDGKGIRSIVTEYYLSTSRDKPVGGMWDTAYPARTQSTYIWTRSHIIYTDGTSEYIGEVCVSGEDGENTLVLDIDNELIPIACYPDGTPLPGQLPITATVRVFNGNRVDSGWVFEAVTENCTGSVNANGVITITALVSTAGSAALIVNAAKGGNTLSATLKVPMVKNGHDSVLYTLLPSASAISRNSDGTLSSPTITFTKQKTVGNNPTTVTTEKRLFIRQDGVDATYTEQAAGTSATATINSKASAVSAELRDNDGISVLDRERIPILTDASGLLVGGTNLLRNTDYLDGEALWMNNFPEESNVWILPKDNTLGYYQGRRTMGVSYLSGTDKWRSVMQSVKGLLRKGGIYTLSGWIYIPSLANINDTLYIRMQWREGREDLFNLKAVAPAKWVFVSTRITVPDDYYATDEVRLMWQLETFGEFFLNGWKFEEGNMATAWSASPEDTSYLRTALTNSTDIEGGLIAATLIRLGYTNTDGERRTMAGLNGALSGNERDIAFWAGGDMDGSTTGIRHDGTAYFSDGEVRMEKGRMEVGDNVILDKQGLKMLGSDNTVRFSLTNAAIDDFDDLTNTVVTRGSDTPEVKTFNIRKASNAAVYFMTERYIKSYNFGSLKAGTSIVANIGIEIPFAIGGGAFLNKAIISVYSNGVLVGRSTYPLTVAINGVALSASFTVDINTQSSCSIELTIPGTAYNGGNGIDYTTASGSVRFMATATSGVSNAVKSGSNGFVAVWGSTVLFCNANEVAMAAGNYGIKVTSTGIYVRDETSGKWRLATI